MKLYDSYSFLCTVRSSENGFNKVDARDEVEEDNELIEVLSTDMLSDADSAQNDEDDAEIEVIQIEHTNEVFQLQPISEPEIKKYKLRHQGGHNTNNPDMIITPHYFFNTWQNSEGKRVKRINVVPKERHVDEHDQFNFELEFGQDEENEIIQCKYCEKAFTIEHHSMVHLRKSHLCSLCLKCFKKSKDLNSHVKTHNSFTCIYCKQTHKTFHSNALYKVHLKKNHNIQLPAHLNLIDSDCREILHDI